MEAKIATENLQIYGYYAAAENFYDNSLEKAPGSKIADKIAENNSSACFVVVSLYMSLVSWNILLIQYL